MSRPIEINRTVEIVVTVNGRTTKRIPMNTIIEQSHGIGKLFELLPARERAILNREDPLYTEPETRTQNVVLMRDGQ